MSQPSVDATKSSQGAGSGKLDMEGIPLPKAEQRKRDSLFLKEPLLTELGNDLPNFSEDALQILKFHGSYQQDDRDKREKGKDKQWQMMLRLRSPGGRIPTALFLAMNDLADRLGEWSEKVTTASNFIDDQTPELFG